MPGSNCCFLTGIQVSQEADRVVCYSHLFKNFPHCVVIHTVKNFSVINEATAKSLQSCLILCDPIDISPPGSPIPGILQARTLEGVAISFSNAWKWSLSLNRVRLLVTPWTAAYQAPPSKGFSRQEYWSGAPLPPPQWSRSRCFSGILLLFFDDPTDVGNLISGSSAFSKSRLYIYLEVLSSYTVEA